METPIYTIAEVKKRAEALNYKCAALLDNSGKKIIAGNTIKDPSKLPFILDKIQHLPEDVYILHVYDGGRNEGYKFHVNTGSKKISKDPYTMAENLNSNLDAQQLGKLQSDFEHAQTMIAQLQAELAQKDQYIEDLETQIQDLQLMEPDPLEDPIPPAPDPWVKIAEGFAPAIPGLLDGVIDFLKGKAKGQTSEPAAAAGRPVVDYDELAKAMIKQANQAAAMAESESYE
jgi:hypothetical protein